MRKIVRNGTRLKKWNLKDLPRAVAESTNYAQVTRKLKIGHIYTNYRTIKYYIAELKLDTSHFDDSAMLAGLQVARMRWSHKPEDIFKKDTGISNGIVRRHFRKLVEQKCVLCGNVGEHLGKPLLLQMDHINGNRNDNRFENLRLLCPNCHSQTETFGNKSSQPKFVKKRYTKVKPTPREKKGRPKKINWPEIDILYTMAEENGYEHTGRVLNVTGASVKKHLRKHNRSLPPFFTQSKY